MNDKQAHFSKCPPQFTRRNSFIFLKIFSAAFVKLDVNCDVSTKFLDISFLIMFFAFSLNQTRTFRWKIVSKQQTGKKFEEREQRHCRKKYINTKRIQCNRITITKLKK